MDPAVTTNRLLDPKVIENFKVMADAGASFELILFPHQLREAADVLDTVPHLVTIINHRGMPSSVEEIKSTEYWDGMKRLAVMSNVYMKISFHGFTDKAWD